MHGLDYVIVLIPILVVVAVSWAARRQVRSVADFMAASRCGGRYLICTAAGESALGAISVVAIFEYINRTGFAITWWQTLVGPVWLLVTLTGFIAYRYRETRVLTMAQFFEIRYSKGFRILAGVLGFVSGIVNFGIFPAVGARFFVNYCGLPQAVTAFGLSVPTFAILMVVFLSIGLFLTLAGGQVTIMISDCLEGLISGVLYLVVAAALLCLFSWSDIFTALAAAPPGESMLNPFDTAKIPDFNIWYVLIGLAAAIYSHMSWQGGHAYRASAISPHEAKMGNILGLWRGTSRSVMIVLLAVCAFTFLNHPGFATGAAQVDAALEQIPEAQIQTQMRVPVALAHILPLGIKGAFACIMLFAMIACDSSYLHSWGSIFVQDVVLPLRRQPLTPQQHIRVLRWAISGVALFAFLFSLFFNQTEYILMFWAITGAIFLGGSGCALIGGLYWKKGTTAGAWVGMLTGSALATLGIVLQQWWTSIQPLLVQGLGSGPVHDYLVQHVDRFPLNGQWIFFTALCSATVLYVVVSLLTCRQDFNMERMLHRGRYAVETAPDTEAVPLSRRFTWSRLLGIDEHFSKGDKVISGSLFGWNMLWVVVVAVGSLWYLLRPWSLETWGRYWFITGILLPFVIGVVTTVWFTWGGLRDLRRLFRDLGRVQRDALDDGTVINHQNLDETSAPRPVPGAPLQAEEPGVELEPAPSALLDPAGQ